MLFLNINKIFCSFQQIHKHFAKKFPNLPMNNWIGFHVSTKQSRIFLVLRQIVSADCGSFCMCVYFSVFLFNDNENNFCHKANAFFVVLLVDVVRIVNFWLVFVVFLPKYHIFITIYVFERYFSSVGCF